MNSNSLHSIALLSDIYYTLSRVNNWCFSYIGEWSMQYVKLDNLKSGMRIGRPIYNKKGVMLFDRDNVLTDQSIANIKKFDLGGIYILEPAEPLPPMTQADRDFERFQAVNFLALDNELKDIINTRHARRIYTIAEDVIAAYGHLHEKLNFNQDVRSHEDYAGKHSLNVAILAAMMCNKMNVPIGDRLDCVVTCLVHDIGKAAIPEKLFQTTPEHRLDKLMDQAQEAGFEVIDAVFGSNPNIRRNCVQTFKLLAQAKFNRESEKCKVVVGARILTVADTFETMTSMGSGHEPASQVEALRFMQSMPEIFHPKAIEALVDSINILGPGTSVELSNGANALVVSTNYGNVLRPVVIDFRTNELMDLSNLVLFEDIEIVDVVKKMDRRYVMDPSLLRKPAAMHYSPKK